MDDFIELRQILVVLQRRWWLLLSLPLITAVAGFLISISQPSVYQATTTILIGQTIQSADLNRTDIQTSEALALTYADIAVRQPVLQRVIEALDLGIGWRNLRNRVSAEPVVGTQLLEISAEAESPAAARTIADEVANQLILLSPNSVDTESEALSAFNRQQIAYLQERILSDQKRLEDLEVAIQKARSEVVITELQSEKADLEGLLAERQQMYLGLVTFASRNTTPNSLTVIEPAQASNFRIRPRVQLNTVLSGVIGLIFAVGLAFLLNYFADTYDTVEEMYKSLNLTVFGVVGKIRGKKPSERLITELEPDSPILESYRIARSRIGFRTGDSPRKSIAVVSAMPGEGKSLTAANLAIVMAQAGLNTILVDADLRRSTVHKLFGVDNEVGMSDLLTSQKISVNDCLIQTHVDCLRIITSGKRISDTTERLSARRLSEVMKEIKRAADVVIFDSPPVMLVADSSILSSQVDGVILVIQAGKTKRAWIRQTVLDLGKANGNLMGCIINRTEYDGSFLSYKSYKYAS